MAYTALITGASAGLGAEFARQLAAMRVDLVLVARDEARLDELAEALRGRYGVGVEVLAADLTDDAGLERVADRVAGRRAVSAAGDARDAAGADAAARADASAGADDTAAGTDAAASTAASATTVEAVAAEAAPAAGPAPVDILVNNAGFGVYDGFEHSRIADERRLHELLSWAPLRLAHAAVPGMLQRGRGWILNVASVAAFTPSGTYGAAKAAVVSLSRSLNARYRRRGVRVTALCPGLLDTEFHERMGVDHLPPLPRIAWASTERVAREGLRALRRGRSVVLSDWRYRLLRPLIAVLPDRLLERTTTTQEPAG